MDIRTGDRLRGVILSNGKIAFVVASFGGDVMRVYRNEMSPGQSDAIGASIDVVVTSRLDSYGKPVLSNLEAFDSVSVASV